MESPVEDVDVMVGKPLMGDTHGGARILQDMIHLRWGQIVFMHEHSNQRMGWNHNGFIMGRVIGIDQIQQAFHLGRFRASWDITAWFQRHHASHDAGAILIRQGTMPCITAWDRHVLRP
jgi:hypothetical protein